MSKLGDILKFWVGMDFWRNYSNQHRVSPIPQFSSQSFPSRYFLFPLRGPSSLIVSWLCLSVPVFWCPPTFLSSLDTQWMTWNLTTPYHLTLWSASLYGMQRLPFAKRNFTPLRSRTLTKPLLPTQQPGSPSQSTVFRDSCIASPLSPGPSQPTLFHSVSGVDSLLHWEN